MHLGGLFLSGQKAEAVDPAGGGHCLLEAFAYLLCEATLRGASLFASLRQWYLQNMLDSQSVPQAPFVRWSCTCCCRWYTLKP